MKFLRIAVVCCLISMSAVFPCGVRKASGNSAKCAPPAVEAAYKNSKAVFVGEVLSVASDGDVKTFTFAVEKNWKGATSEEIEVSVQETMRYQAWFKVGEKYLVYARGNGKDDERLWEFRCSRSKSLEHAAEDITKLGRVKKPAEKLEK